MAAKTLTWDEVQEICAGYRGAKYPAEQVKILAELYEASPGEIVAVLKENGYAVEDSTAKQAAKGWRPDKRTMEKRAAMREDLVAGMAPAEVALKHGVSRQTVYNLKKGAK